MNTRLRESMEARRVTVKRISEQTQVDPKTVQRWVNGRVPHTQHRWKVAEILNEREDYLWPNEGNEQNTALAKTDEILAAYGKRADVPVEAWWNLFKKSEKNIDLLGFALLFLPEQHPGLSNLLVEKSKKGCLIRIAVADPKCHYVKERDDEEKLEGTLQARIVSTLRHFRELQNCPNVMMRYHRSPMYNSTFRFDDEMFVTPHLYGLHGNKAPLLHIRRLSNDGLYKCFHDSFEALWATTIPTKGSK